MANRKQFITQTAANPELDALLKIAKKTKVTEEQLHEQRVSFAFGNAPASKLITKASVLAASKKILLST